MQVNTQHPPSLHGKKQKIKTTTISKKKMYVTKKKIKKIKSAVEDNMKRLIEKHIRMLKNELI